ncbi:hypothetical protein J6G99_06475 [bacterium]|nr:hypothetical protein [bacterium]
MILLFGEKANKSHKNSNIKTHPVENSGILAMHKNDITSLLDANEYDTYMFSQQAEIDYSMYASDSSYVSYNTGFMADFANAYSTLGESTGFSSSASFDCGGGCSSFSSCGSFSSVC